MPVLNPSNIVVLEECSNPKCKKPLPPSEQFDGDEKGVFCDDCFVEIEITNHRITLNRDNNNCAEIYV